MASGISLYQNEQSARGLSAGAGYKGKDEKGMKGGGKGWVGYGGRGKGGVRGQY